MMTSRKGCHHHHRHHHHPHHQHPHHPPRPHHPPPLRPPPHPHRPHHHHWHPRHRRRGLPGIPFGLSPGGSWVATGTTTALEGESGHETNDQNTGRSHQNPGRSLRAAAACMAASSEASSRP